MEPDILLCTPLAIDECVHHEFPDSIVQIDGEKEVLNIVLPQSFDLPNGSQVTISTVVSRKLLVDSINAIAQYRFTVQEASKSLLTCTPLSGWKEGREMQSYGIQRRQFEQKQGSCSDTIVAYAKQPNDQACMSEIRKLGLAPDQVKPHDLDALRYFREIQVRKLSLPSMKFLATRYAHVYAVLKEQCFQEEVSKIKAEEPTEPASLSDSIEKTLHNRVVGQDMAVSAMASALLRKHGKANKTFLFVGPPGVGKTELSEAVGDFKGSGLFIKFDMANYQSEYQASAFSGSPTGCVGSDDLPEFCKQVNASKGTVQVSTSQAEDNFLVRNVVILFDEIGKAHTTIRSSLLSLFSSGTHSAHCTVREDRYSPGVNKTMKYTFENCLFIGTSNLFQELIVEASIQKMKMQDIVAGFIKASAQAVSRGYPTCSGEIPFTPEVLSRMAVVPFVPIPRGPDGFQKIVEMKLNRWLRELNELFHELFPGNFKGVVVEPGNRGALNALIETGMYGNGTNVRRLVSFLDELQTELVKKKGLRMTSKVELSIYASGNTIYAQRYIVDISCFLRKKYEEPIPLHSFEIADKA